MLVLLAAFGPVALAGPGDPPNKPKGSAFAPHHTQSHVYGTPIAKPILHQRKKPVKSAAHRPVAPIK